MSTTPLRIGLMGFGRIGRNVFRQLHDNESVEVAAIIDTTPPESLTYLLKYDSIYGRFPHPVRLDGDRLTVDDRVTVFRQDVEPGDTDWNALGVEVVVQATGKYRTAEWCQRHLKAGASRVILASTPETPGDVPILLRGINDEILTPDTRIIALGSNTSNAVAPVLRVLDESFGVNRVFFTTVHAFTNRERLADVPGSDGFRTSRAAGENIIPAETNSPEILVEVMPEFAGKISAMALNVPVPDGSTVDMVTEVRQPTTAEEVNEAVRVAASSDYRHLLEFVEDPIVSSDVVGSTYSGVFDALATMVTGETLVKTIVWFDNGWGYSARIVEIIGEMAAFDQQEVQT